MEPLGVASTSSAVAQEPPRFTGFTPPAWIFSHATTSSASSNLRLDLDSGEDAHYGPTLKRRGNVKFVKAKGLDGFVAEEEVSGVKGKEKEKERKLDLEKDGLSISEFYTATVSRQSSTKPPPRPRIKSTKSGLSASTSTPDIDLTLSSESEREDSEDDMIVLDPKTLLPLPPFIVQPPLPPPAPTFSRPIHELLENASALPPPLPAPISYGSFHENHFARKMLTAQGWVEGQALGLTHQDTGLKVPLKPSDKFDKGGLGAGGSGSGDSRKEKAAEREKRKREEEEEMRAMGIGKGARGIARRRYGAYIQPLISIMTFTNKEKALKVFASVSEVPYNPEPVAALFAPTFTSHHLGNPVYVGTGGDWLAFFKEIADKAGGNVQLDVKKAVEDGDQVWLWYIMTGLGPVKEGVEMFTFNAEGQILEKWDVQQVGVQE